MKIAALSDSTVTSMHQLVGGLTDSFKELKVTMNDDINKEYTIDLPVVVQSTMIFLKCVQPTDTNGNSLGALVHLRVEGVADNFANVVRDTGAITSVVL